MPWIMFVRMMTDTKNHPNIIPDITPTLSRRSFVTTTLCATGLASMPATAFAATDDIDAALSPRFMGSADAPVQVAEYYSMTCGHCAAFHNEVFPLVKTKLIDKGLVRFEMRPFPLDGLALRAHALVRSLPQSKFFPMVKTLLAQQPSWVRAQDPLAALMKIALFAGVSADSFNAIMRNRALLEGIVEIRQVGLDKWKVSATPSFVINDDTTLSGNMSYEEFAGHLSAYGA